MNESDQMEQDFRFVVLGPCFSSTIIPEPPNGRRRVPADEMPSAGTRHFVWYDEGKSRRQSP